MNLFVTHGKLIYAEPPKAPGRASLMMLEVGKPKAETDALIQLVNKVIIRIAPNQPKIVESLKPGDYLEVMGHFGGVVHRSMADQKQHLGVELVTSSIQKTKAMVPEKSIDKMLYNEWYAIGLVRGYKPPPEGKGNRPGTFYVQIGPDREDSGQRIQKSGVVSISVHGDVLNNRLAELEPNQAVRITGGLMSVMRKIPRMDVDDGYTSSLETSLMLRTVALTAMVAEKMTIPIPAKKGRPEKQDKGDGAGSVTA